MEEKAGLYIHFPFCKKKCLYCHFYSIPSKRESLKRWIKGLIDEMSIYSELSLGFDTLYIGGGTPSLLYPEDVIIILEHARKFFNLQLSEFTMEVNPDVKEREILKGWKEAGVNRISIGIQSFDKNSLEILGRDYNPAQAIDFFFKCREENFENINLDLILGLPGERRDNPKKILENIKIMMPDHISIYILESYEGLPFEEVVKKYGIPENDFISKEYFELKKGLEFLSFSHYEISNFAKKGKRCVHNLKYWNYMPFLGLGPSACSNLVGKRWCNVSDMDIWLSKTEEKKEASKEVMVLDKNEIAKEAIILGLRLIEGINIQDFNKRFNVDIQKIYGEVIKTLKDEDMIVEEGERLKIKKEKLLLSNEVFLRFL